MCVRARRQLGGLLGQPRFWTRSGGGDSREGSLYPIHFEMGEGYLMCTLCWMCPEEEADLLQAIEETDRGELVEGDEFLAI